MSEIAKMVKSLSSQKIKDLSEFLKENAQIEEAIVKLGDLYFEDKGQINNNIQRFKTIKGEPKPEVEPPFEVLSN